jgi:hypothetical protein
MAIGIEEIARNPIAWIAVNRIEIVKNPNLVAAENHSVFALFDLIERFVG